MVSKIEGIRDGLLKLLEDGKPLDIGKGAETYFRVSRSTLLRAVHRLCNDGIAKQYYLRAGQTGSENRNAVIAVLVPSDWTFAKAANNRHHIVRVADLRTNGTKLKSAVQLTKRDIATIGAAVKTLDETEATPERKAEIIEGVKKQTALRSLDAPKSMLNHRIRQLKKAGYSNRAIGDVLDISESTVRRRLLTPLDPMEILLDKVLADLEDAREEVVAKFIDHQEVEQVFGPGYGDSYIMRVHTNRRKAEISEKLHRVKFSLEFIVAMKNVDGE